MYYYCENYDIGGYVKEIFKQSIIEVSSTSLFANVIIQFCA